MIIKYVQELTFTYPLQRKIGKRCFDLLFSGAALLLGSPIYLILILLVKLTSRGPVFYKATRMGQGGKLIYCWKFRTMCVDAKERLHKLLDSDPELRKEWETFHKLKNDPRLTKIGNFLRKSSLDELPQFWNVFRGDLSVVGPRPIDVENPEEGLMEIRQRYKERTDKILSVKPGITCLWQTMGRSLLTFERRAELEEEYVDRQSFWLDMKIIMKTAYIVLFPTGAC